MNNNIHLHESKLWSNKHIYLLFIPPVIFAITLLLVSNFRSRNLAAVTQNATVTPAPTQEKVPTVKIGGSSIEVEVVDTDEERARGLGQRETLAEGKGMLFIFEGAPSNQVFWMKDMRFNIDIIWIKNLPAQAGGQIARIDSDVPAPTSGTPDNRLPLYSSPGPIDYVLETSAGYMQKMGIKVGDTVDLSSIEQVN